MEIQHLVSNCFNEQFCIVLRVVTGKKPQKKWRDMYIKLRAVHIKVNLTLTSKIK